MSYTTNKNGQVVQTIEQPVDINGTITRINELKQNIVDIQTEIDQLTAQLVQIGTDVPSVAEEVQVVPEVATLLATPVTVDATPSITPPIV